MLSNDVCTGLWVQHRRIDLKVVNARDVNLTLPSLNRIRHRRVRSFCEILAFTAGLTSSSPVHDNRKRASNAHEQHREPGEAPSTIRQDTLAN
jgi:hypothetical protein